MLSYAILEKTEVLITGIHHCMKTWESPKDWTCLDEKIHAPSLHLHLALMEPTLALPTASHDIPCGPPLNMSFPFDTPPPCHVWLDLGNISCRPIRDPHDKVVGSYFMSTFCTSWLRTKAKVRWAPIQRPSRSTKHHGEKLQNWVANSTELGEVLINGLLSTSHEGSWKIYIPTYDKVKSRTNFFFFFFFFF